MAACSELSSTKPSWDRASIKIFVSFFHDIFRVTVFFLGECDEAGALAFQSAGGAHEGAHHALDLAGILLNFFDAGGQTGQRALENFSGVDQLVIALFLELDI